MAVCAGESSRSAPCCRSTGARSPRRPTTTPAPLSEGRLLAHSATARLVELAVAASEQAGLADAWMVIEAMKGYAAVQAGDPAVCVRAVSGSAEPFGIRAYAASMG